jgi:serine/threonine protein kinase
MKDISTTNKSNGADSFILRNQFDNTKNNINTNNNSNNKNDILNPSLKNGNGNNLDNNKDIKDNKDNSELKEFNFNDYKIITQLGQGTFGKIYLVQDKNNQLFSMKKIILSEELDVQSVINEYKMCQKLIHENIVKILGIYNTKLDTTTYVVYILMEVGMTDWEKQISSYVDKKIEYTEKNLINIIKQLSKVLSFLQKNNISHRDIKPQNILIFKNDIYKLADFGEAKQIDAMKNLLVNYSLRGTELYMSPLLFNGLRNGQIDIKHNLFKSDVYSLGLCILFAAVTNNKPLYEIRKFIDMKGVKKYLEKLLKEKYSYKFINLISSMLEIHEKNRPDFIELEKIMKKWK